MYGSRWTRVYVATEFSTRSPPVRGMECPQSALGPAGFEDREKSLSDEANLSFRQRVVQG